MDTLRLDPGEAKEVSFLKIEHGFEDMKSTIERIGDNVSDIKELIQKEVGEMRSELSDWKTTLIDLDKRVTQNERILQEAAPRLRPHEQIVGKWVMNFISVGIGAALMYVLSHFITKSIVNN